MVSAGVALGMVLCMQILSQIRIPRRRRKVKRVGYSIIHQFEGTAMMMLMPVYDPVESLHGYDEHAL